MFVELLAVVGFVGSEGSQKANCLCYFQIKRFVAVAVVVGYSQRFLRQMD